MRPKISNLLVLVLVLTLISNGRTAVPLFLDPEGSCSLTGHLLSCYKSTRAFHILQNLPKYVGKDADVRGISVIESGLTRIPAEIWNQNPSLKSLDLSGNRISDFVPQISHQSLEILNLSRNGIIERLDLDAMFDAFPSLAVVDLSSNEVVSLGKKKPVLAEKEVSLLLRDSNVTCSNATSWLLEWVATESLRDSPRLAVDDARCSSAPLEGVLLTHSFSALSTMNHAICSQCDCFFKPSLHVNCSGRGLTSFPQSLPSQTKVVDLDHNQIQQISLSADWVSVIYLHLKDNWIESLSGLEGNAFAKNIRSLDLQTNRLSDVQAHVLKHLNVDRISLSDNPWRCDCNTIAFQLWIQDHSTQVRDMDLIKCAASATANRANGVDYDAGSDRRTNPLLSSRTIYKILRSDLCPQPSESVAYQFYDVASGIMAFLAMFILCRLVYDWWWQKRTGKLPRFFKLNV